MKNFLLPVLVIFALSLMFMGCNANMGANKVDIEDAVATVNGSAVAKWEYDFYYKQGVEYIQQFGIDLDSEDAQEILIMAEEDAWNTIIANEVTRQVALEKGVKVSDDDAEKVLTEEIIPQSFGDEATFNTWMENYSITREQALGLVRLQKLSYGLFEEMGKETDITEADAQSTYDEAPQDWDNRLVSHILILANRDTATEEEIAVAKKKSEDIIKRLNQGEDFAQLAMELSEDTSSAIAGGKISYAFTANDTQFVEEFVSGSFALEKVGDFSQSPVQSGFGFHIIKVDQINSGFEALKGEVLETLLSTAKNEAYSTLVQSAIDNAEVVRYINFKYWAAGNQEYPPVEGLEAPEINTQDEQQDEVGEEGTEGADAEGKVPRT